jgi:8-oxo-dGTP pyrophosphatase MutT (NUDIX family)
MYPAPVAHPYAESLRTRLQRNLDGFDRRRHSDHHLTPASVALAIVSDEQNRACFVLTRRASKLKDHPGQWALPGGRREPGESRSEAARRECLEEVGLELGPDSQLGVLDDYPTRSGFVITPIVFWCGPTSQLTPNEAEVSAIYRVPLVDLDHADVPQLRSIPESNRPVLSVPLLGTRIHAPTAAILYQLREVAVHGRSTRVDHFEQPVWAWS